MLYINKIPGRFLKDRAKLLTEPLCKIINLSFNSKFPLMWRAAKVKPLYKKGKNTEPKIYRPISWLSILSTIILLDKMKNLVFFSIRVFFHRHWRFTGQQGKGGDHLLFHSTTSTRSRTFRHLFATLHVRWLSHIFNRNACVYQTANRWDLPPYRITIWLIDWWCNVCLFTWWIDSRFLLQQFWHWKSVDLNLHWLSPLYYQQTN